jgi:hypothetical protein
MRYLSALILCVAVAACAAAAPAKKGSPQLKSVTALAFNSDGVLFVGDSTAAKVYAIETHEKVDASKGAIKIEKLTEKIGGMLGVPAAQVSIADVKANPASGSVYLAVRRGTGPDAAAVILKVTRDGKISEFSLKDVMVSSVELPNALSDKRAEAITSIGFANGKLIVAGLSNEEFASTLRVIPFPFADSAAATGVKIYHGAHGKFETQAPVRTFTTYKIGNAEQVIAAYQCTPLVKFPVGDLQPGNKVTGTTIAELGNRNRPLDMIVYKKDGKDFVLIANSARGIMKLAGDSLATNEGITTRVPDKAGVKYETVEGWKDVVQLDKLDDAHAVILTDDKKTVTLASVELP